MLGDLRHRAGRARTTPGKQCCHAKQCHRHESVVVCHGAKCNSSGICRNRSSRSRTRRLAKVLFSSTRCDPSATYELLKRSFRPNRGRIVRMKNENLMRTGGISCMGFGFIRAMVGRRGSRLTHPTPHPMSIHKIDIAAFHAEFVFSEKNSFGNHLMEIAQENSIVHARPTLTPSGIEPVLRYLAAQLSCRRTTGTLADQRIQVVFRKTHYIGRH